MTNSWLRVNLYRDTAPVPICNICYILTDLFHLSTLYRDTRNAHKNLYTNAKTAPCPPCTVTAFWLKYQHRDRCLRRATFTNHIAGPLVKMRRSKIGLAPYLDKFLMTTKLSGTLTTNPDAQPAPGQFSFKL